MSIRIAALAVLILSLAVSGASAQTFGIELHNSLMPASGGMGGASIAQPQDLQSAINGNPASLTQFRGTQFSFSGAWAEPTYDVTQLSPLPGVGVDPFSAKSGTPGSVLGDIGATQDFSAFGLPATAGIGLMTNAGIGVQFRDVPESNGTSAEYLALDMILGTGIELTERLSVGASMALGISYIDGPFVDLTGMVPGYALRGTIGANYSISCNTTLGAYWQTKKAFVFQDAVLFAGGGPPQDLHFDHPENIGIGVANTSFAGGRLLLAMDVLFKRYSDADFLKGVYEDQWVFQFGTQYRVNKRIRLRLGYAYNENPMRQNPVVTSIGGIDLPDGIPGVRYVQGQFAAVSQHRLTGGVGIRDALPGVDFDLFAGGMFEGTDQLASTIVSVESYWLGAGLTWRFGRGACEDLPVADDWGRASMRN